MSAICIEPKPRRSWGEEMGWDPGRSSQAILACDGHDGVVLCFVGADIAFEIEEMGMRALSDLGLDNAPKGLCMWEGKFVWHPATSMDPSDGEYEPEGRFRSLTTHELFTFVKDGQPPWDESTWRIPGWVQP